jgi:hypothetical protein
VTFFSYLANEKTNGSSTPRLLCELDYRKETCWVNKSGGITFYCEFNQNLLFVSLFVYLFLYLFFCSSNSFLLICILGNKWEHQNIENEYETLWRKLR